MSAAVMEFIDAMRDAGIHPVEPIANRLASGNPVRFRAEGDKPGRLNGWAWLHLDGIPAGVFRHYRLGVRSVWRAGTDQASMSPAERRALNEQVRALEAQRRAAMLARQEAAADRACALWRSAGKANPAHGYLARKGLAPVGIRQHGDALLVPMFDPGFRLWNVQRIWPDPTRSKLFLKDGHTTGLFWPHGIFTLDGRPTTGPLVIGEGYSTMAAIHQATGHGVVAAMSWHNLESVARTMQTLFPGRTIVIAADDDTHLDENVGLCAAQRAAAVIGAHLATPRPVEGRMAHA